MSSAYAALRAAALPALLLTAACAGADGEQTDVPDGPPVDPMVNTYIPADFGAVDPKRVMYLGDSITAGYGVSARGAYPNLLLSNATNLWPDFEDVDLDSIYPGSTVEKVDVSVPGAKTDDLVARQLPDLARQLGPQVSGESIAVITIGGNDLSNSIIAIAANPDQADVVIDNIVDNLNQMMDFFQDSERFPDGVSVYYANVYEPTDGLGQADECFAGVDLEELMEDFERANQEMRRVGEERGASVIDLRGHFLGHGYNRSDTDNAGYDEADHELWFQNDCIHPNSVGHHELRRLFAAAIAGEPMYLPE